MSSSSILVPNLPNDIAVQCIARIPRSFHPKLALVCRSWHSLITSPHFFSTRSHLKCTEQFLYISIRNRYHSFEWFVYHISENPSKLFRLPPFPSPATNFTCVMLGPLLFVLGGSVKRIPTSTVWIYDARINRWEIGPEMRASRDCATSAVLNGKIYVLGGCSVDPWAEVFDPGLGSWAPVPRRVIFRRSNWRWISRSVVLGGKLFAFVGAGGVVFDQENLSWGSLPEDFHDDFYFAWIRRAPVIDGILYCFQSGGHKIMGYDEEEDKWKLLQVIGEELPSGVNSTLVNVEGRLCLLWEEGDGESELMEIFCAVIEVGKDSSGELQGSVVWSEDILRIPRGSSLCHCLQLEL
ncbi:F-box/kelch-repeat protein SKIP6-like [Tasmannia lanceolata]|uniref:F-box/kelch-repeat protein SKIP6-like n=1 Tax=Tasmannia lanceolata TaxID=3420 RepID=UPI004062935E